MLPDNAAPTCPATEGRTPTTNMARGEIRSVSAPAMGIEISTITMKVVIGSPMVSSWLKLPSGV